MFKFQLTLIIFSLQLDRSYIQEEAIVSKECFEYSKEDLTPVRDLKFAKFFLFDSDQCLQT